MENKEIRTITLDIETREENDTRTIAGYGAVFNTLSNDLGGFRESIGSEAFEGRTNDDVRYLLNHDPNFIYGRTTAGTLRLSVDEKGLRYEVDLPNTQSANELYTSIQRGDITQSSFAFVVEDDSWEERDGQIFRTINKVSRLFDVSSVVYPAYNDAPTFALRSLEKFKEEIKKEEPKVETPQEETPEEENKSTRLRDLNTLKLTILKSK